MLGHSSRSLSRSFRPRFLPRRGRSARFASTKRRSPTSTPRCRAAALTCRALVQAYLDRIEAYDKQGPAINAITVVNPDALATADSLDRRFAANRQFVGPLHCVPMIVKDNFQTIGLQTAAGNLALKGYAPSKDAFQVAPHQGSGRHRVSKV